MQIIIDFIKSNYEWLFDGLGILLLTTLGGMIFKKRVEKKNVQIIDNASSGLQAMNSININTSPANKNNSEQTSSATQQSITRNSSGIQAGGDININIDDSKLH